MEDLEGDAGVRAAAVDGAEDRRSLPDPVLVVESGGGQGDRVLHVLRDLGPVRAEVEHPGVDAQAAGQLRALPLVLPDDHLLGALAGNTDHILPVVVQNHMVAVVGQTAHAGQGFAGFRSDHLAEQLHNLRDIPFCDTSHYQISFNILVSYA